MYTYITGQIFESQWLIRGPSKTSCLKYTQEQYELESVCL